MRLVFRAVPIALVAVLLVGAGLAGQAPAPKSTYQPKKTADGQPDLQGYWLTGGMGGGALVEGGSEANLSGRTGGTYKSPIIDPANGQIPWQPWAAERYQELRKNIGSLDRQYIDPVALCLPAGAPRIMYVTPYNGYQFIQTPGYVLIVAEWNHIYRIIPTDGRPHLPAHMKLWSGDERGRWEGNTLVVETTNTNGHTWFQIVGGFESDAWTSVERFTMVDANLIRYEATITDPKLFTQPWTLVGRFGRANISSDKPDQPVTLTSAGFTDAPRENYELYEYACHEGNRYFDTFLAQGKGDKPKD